MCGSDFCAWRSVLARRDECIDALIPHVAEWYFCGSRVLYSLPQWGKVPSEAEADEVSPPKAASAILL